MKTLIPNMFLCIVDGNYMNNSKNNVTKNNQNNILIFKTILKKIIYIIINYIDNTNIKNNDIIYFNYLKKFINKL